MYKRKKVEELSIELEKLDKDEFDIREWTSSEFIQELFWVVRTIYLKDLEEFNFKLGAITYKEAITFLDFIDEIPIDVLNQLSNGSAHEIAGLLIKNKLNEA